ncbi:hypothetical protein, partial [Streptomyces sp. NPDC021470]|uniref:hypothetical protein n=1 Tax=Streptomyces sp. NPDC021470 TaxID=3154902 RepID=UPI0033C9B471
MAVSTFLSQHDTRAVRATSRLELREVGPAHGLVAEAVEAAPVASLATALADEPGSGVRGHIRDIA